MWNITRDKYEVQIMKCEHSQTLDIQFHIPGYRHINRTFAAIAAATGVTGFLVNFIFSVDPAQYSTGLDKNIEKCTSTRTRVIAIFRYRHRNVRRTRPVSSGMLLFLERRRSHEFSRISRLRFNLTRESNCRVAK